MSTAKHTPSPWRYDPYQELPGFREPAGVDTGKGRWVVEYSGMTSHEEFEAHARLIAAAPDLLDACRKALYAIKGREHDQFIRDAIAKATGEQS